MNSPRTLTLTTVLELTSPQEIEAAQRLRYSVWQSEGATIHQPELEAIADYHDNHAIHWGVFDGTHLVGAARLCLHDNLNEAPDGEMFAGISLPTPIASMNRLVVLKTHRGLGIGRQLDTVRLKAAEQLGARVLIGTPANAASRRDTLGRRGFKFVEGVFGHPIWSPSFSICACYLLLGETEIAQND